MPFREGSWRPPEVQVDVDSIDVNTRLLSPSGELDVSTAQVLDDAFRIHTNGGGSRVVLDLAKVSFIDSTVMALIAEWRDRLLAADGAFALVTVDPQQRRLFDLTELTERLRVSATRDDAVRALDEAGSADQRADRSP